MGLRYEKILECRNDCMLFWKDNKDLDLCTVCGESKWRADIHLHQDGDVISSRKKRLVKVFRWFSLIPRLQRLFMSGHTAHYMRWHAKGSTRDGVLRHPSDGEAWIDSRWIQSFWKHEHIPQHMARIACTVQFAFLDVHETDVIHHVTSYPWTELT